MFLGSKTGRGTDKMKENMLTVVKMPSGNMAYKEAKLIVECSLTELTTVSPEDFYTEYGQDFINDGYREAKDYHKMVFGEIVNVWTRK
jgi:flavin reductase (DIM6/NTAB) family NADH-FMN oxidoreductase RutF